jgi:hypothetical protein
MSEEAALRELMTTLKHITFLQVLEPCAASTLLSSRESANPASNAAIVLDNQSKAPVLA